MVNNPSGSNQPDVIARTFRIEHGLEYMNDLRALVERGKRRRPELATRLDRAAVIALLRTVRLLPDGTYLVESDREIGRFYHVRRQCECADRRRAPGGWCKHRLAIGLLAALARRPFGAANELSALTTARLAVLETATNFAASRPWLSSADVLQITQEWDSWVLSLTTGPDATCDSPAAHQA
ncbi:MAG: hypothetical protein JO352_03850 [Chloroflexi bacterium]|nr:hypothetical protein [Chloroflexota bacterium]